MRSSIPLLLLAVLAAACSFTGSDQRPDSTAVPATAAVTPTVEPGEVVLAPNGLGVVSFGAEPEAAIAAVARALGLEPDVDTGWIDPFTSYGACPGTEARAVEFGDLVLLFTDGATSFAAAGTRHYYAFNYAAGSRGPDNLIAATGIGIGSTLAEVQAAYGPAFRFNTAYDGDGGPGFDIGYEEGSSELLYGSFGGPDAAAILLELNGGVGCAE